MDRILTGAQLRAARGLINLSGEELAERTQLGLSTIRRAESEDGPVRMTRANANLIRMTLERMGVEFLEPSKAAGVGVRLAAQTSTERKGSKRP